MKTFVYVDGFNLYYGALKGTPLRWLDIPRLVATAFPHNQISFTKYFTAKVTPLPRNPEQRVRQELYWRALRTLQNFQIIEGHFRTREVRAPVVSPPPDFVLVYKTEEKGSDVNLAAHLLMDGFGGHYDAAIVVSGDSDLLVPVRMVREQLNKPIGVLNPQRLSGPDHRPERKSAGLKSAASFYQKGVTWAQLQASQFPSTLTDAKGTFTKPASW